MGKKKSARSGGDAAKATAFVLKVPMHCRCDGCAAVKDLTLNHDIEALDQSALWTKGELRVASTADPEKLRRRLHKATGKSVGLVVLKPQAAADKEAAMEELLRRSLQQQGQYGQAAWPNQVLPGAAWSALQQPAGYGYAAAPWAVQVQQPEAYQSAYPPVAAPGARTRTPRRLSWAMAPTAADGTTDRREAEQLSQSPEMISRCLVNYLLHA